MVTNLQFLSIIYLFIWFTVIITADKSKERSKSHYREMSILWQVHESKPGPLSTQRRLDTRRRTRDYFAFQWPLIDLVLMKLE